MLQASRLTMMPPHACTMPCGCVRSLSILRTGPPVIGVHVYCDEHRPQPRPSGTLCGQLNAAAGHALASCRNRRQCEVWGVLAGLAGLLVLTVATAALARKYAATDPS